MDIEDQKQMVEATAQTVRDKINSGRNESESWKMTVWTNDRLLLTRTEEWAKGQGMQMRELKELPIFEEYRDVFDRMLADNVVMASDLGRFLILHDVGGLYLDFDQVLYEWDERLNSFEFLSYTTDQFSFGYLIAETSFIGATPKHPLVKEMLQQIRDYMTSEALVNQNSSRAHPNFMQRSKCFATSFYRNMQASGPYRFTAAFNQAFKDGNISDKVLFFPQPIVMRGQCPSWE